MEAPNATPNPKVLVVEDSEDLLLVWRALFRKAGIPARFCANGQTALWIIEHERYHPDIVMTDYYLPDTTGLDLIAEIDKRSADIRCVMVTGNRDDSFVKAARKRNVTLVFKPVRFPDLLRTLRAIATEREGKSDPLSCGDGASNSPHI